MQTDRRGHRHRRPDHPASGWLSSRTEAAKALATNLQARARLGRRTQAGRQGQRSAPPASASRLQRGHRRGDPDPGAHRRSRCPTARWPSQLRSYSELELAFELATQERDLGRQVIDRPERRRARTPRPCRARTTRSRPTGTTRRSPSAAR